MYRGGESARKCMVCDYEGESFAERNTIQCPYHSILIHKPGTPDATIRGSGP